MDIKDRGGKVIFTRDDREKGAVDLSALDLKDAVMRSLDLKSANLKKADIRTSDLREANVSGSNMAGVKGSNANFKKANCRNAIFFDAELVSTSFINADLRHANFGRANLSNSDLTGAILDGADFLYANLFGVIGLDKYSIIVDGSLIGWKKLAGDLVAKLLIPGDSRRVNALGSRFCRAESAIVLAIETIKGGQLKEGFSLTDKGFMYEVDQTVTPDRPFNDDIRRKCGSGIHFFLTRDEAVRF